MNQKQLAFLLLLVAVLGSAGLVIYKKRNTSWAAPTTGVGQKLFSNLPVNDITQITIRQASNQVNLVRKDDAWSVRERQDYPADFSQIRDFLIKARELKAAQVDQIGASQLSRLQLADGQGSNAATVVEFKGGNGQTLQSLLLGKMHLKKSSQPAPFGQGGDDGWPDGRYVKVGGDPENVAIVSDPLEHVEPRPERWLNKEFIRVEKARSIEVAFPVATNSWKLTRETEAGEWKLADARPEEQLDPAKTAAISNPLASESFNDVLPGDLVNGGGTSAPVVMKIETFDHFAYTVKVGSKANEEYLVTVAAAGQIAKDRAPGADEKPEDKAKLDKEFKDKQQKLEEKLKQEQNFGKWTYRIGVWGIDSLLKERSQLLAEKKEEPKADGASTNSVPKIAEP